MELESLLSTKLFIGPKYQIETTTFDMNFRVNPKIKDERKKQQEFKNSTGRQIDKVYALAHLDEAGIERFFYVGICVDYAQRWKQHYSAILAGKDPKDAYFYARRIGPEKIYMVELDPEGKQTEREWEEAMLQLGHPLQNVGTTVDSMRKKRVKSPVQLAFEQVNKPRPGELDELVRAAKVKGWI